MATAFVLGGMPLRRIPRSTTTIHPVGAPNTTRCVCFKVRNIHVLRMSTAKDAKQSAKRAMAAAVLALYLGATSIYLPTPPTIQPAYAIELRQDQDQSKQPLQPLQPPQPQNSNTILLVDKAQPLSTDPGSQEYYKSFTPEQRTQMQDMSVKNTRVTGANATLFTEAKRAAEQGDLDKALQLYGDLMDKMPKFASAYSNRANIYVAQRKYDDAIKEYTKALELAPWASDTWVVYLNRASTLVQQQKYADAYVDFTRALELRKDEPLILTNRAQLYSMQGRWDAALNDYQKAVEKTSGSVEPFWLDYGLALFEKGMSIEAQGILRRLLAKYDHVDDVNAAYAMMAFTAGDLSAAETRWSMVNRPKLFTSTSYLKEHRWPPKCIEAMDKFQKLSE